MSEKDKDQKPQGKGGDKAHGGDEAKGGDKAPGGDKRDAAGAEKAAARAAAKAKKEGGGDKAEIRVHGGKPRQEGEAPLRDAFDSIEDPEQQAIRHF